MAGGPNIYYVILLLCIIYILLRVHARLLERRQRLQRARTLTAPSRRRSRLRDRNDNANPSFAESERNSESDVNLEQEREDRRALVLTSLIVKKAVVKEDNENGVEIEDSNPREKDNIFIRSLRSGLAFVNFNPTNDPNVCSICLEPYKENEEICWSKNENCTHAFHLDCMVNWLMDHDECPICRSAYLHEHVKGDDSV